jgi:hypothetical protein
MGLIWTNAALKKCLEGLGTTPKFALFNGKRTGGATTINTPTVTMTSTTGLAAGMRCEHANIPANTRILTVDNGTTVTVSANATASGSSLTLVFSPGLRSVYMTEVVALEISTTGYTGGFGGSGRKNVTPAYSKSDTNSNAMMDCDDPTWTTIGVSGGVDITHVVVHIPGTSSDTDALIIGSYPYTQTVYGGNCTVNIDALGLGTLAQTA